MVVAAGEKVTDEQVAEARPDVMVLAWAATGAKAQPEQAYRVAAWEDVPAIRERRVFVVRDELLNTPGPPLMRGARALWSVMWGTKNTAKTINTERIETAAQRVRKAQRRG
jgi:ABC-type hemin transport system substrate-binding protein